MLNIKNHLSLLVMLIGAGVQFLSSLLLYKFMDPVQYGLFGLFVTFLSIAFSFGLFGSEQTFMRLCSIDDKRVVVSRNVAMLIILCLLFGPVVLATMASMTFLKGISVIELYLIALVAVVVMFGYNYQRMLGNFVESQLLNNFWRISILVSLLWGFFFDVSFEVVYFVIALSLVISAVFFLYRAYENSHVNIVINDDGVGYVSKLSLSFLFSMGVLTALSFFDRYLIGAKFSVKEFGEFFFLQNLFAHPFILIANYFGFKGLVEYKNKFDLRKFNKRVILLSISAPIMAAVYIWFIVLMDNFRLVPFGLSDSTSIIIPLALFGCTRLVYSTLSAAMGAKGNSIDVFIVNFISIIFAIGVAWNLIHIDASIEMIAWSMVLLWVLRCALYYFGIRRSVSEI